uniref:hypothetical protein n=2 Tax=Flavobacterium sp. TaxID=239 RepID=UPI00404B24FD
MKKIIISALTALVLISCGIEYNGEERLRVLLKIQDNDLNALEGIEVQIDNLVDSYNETISIGHTKSDGTLDVVFPATESDSARYNIEFKDPNNLFASYRISNIKKTDFNNYQLILDPQTLYRYSDLVNLQITRNQINSHRYLGSTNIIGMKYLSDIDFQNGTELPNYSTNTFFKVFKNQTIILEYAIQDRSTQPYTIESFSVPIEINEEDVTYTIDL